MEKRRLIDGIARLCPGLTDRRLLGRKTVEQLRAIYARWQNIAAVTPAECARHCDTSFLPKTVTH